MEKMLLIDFCDKHLLIEVQPLYTEATIEKSLGNTKLKNNDRKKKILTVVLIYLSSCFTPLFLGSGFTSLIPAGPNEFVMIYQKYLNPGVWPPFPEVTFQMKISMPPRHKVPIGPTSSHPPLWVWVVSGIAACIIALIAYSILTSKSAMDKKKEYYRINAQQTKPKEQTRTLFTEDNSDGENV